MTQEQKQTEAEIEALWKFLQAMEKMCEDIAGKHPTLFQAALFTMATFIVEKVYICSPTPQSAGKLLSDAQQLGLDNWAAYLDQAGQIDNGNGKA